MSTTFEQQILESAQISTPATAEENIRRGREAMKHVIATKSKDAHAMYRKEFGWVAFSWGTPGTLPPDFKSQQEAAEWWANLPGSEKDKGKRVFSSGRGVSHIIAKRDWEAKWMKRFSGQKGEDIAFQCVEAIAKGTLTQDRHKKIINYKSLRVSLIPDSRWVESKALREQGKKKDEYWLLSGLEMVAKGEKYEIIMESAEDMRGGTHPSHSTHPVPTVTRHEVGAADSLFQNIQHPDTDSNISVVILESAQISTPATPEENIRRGREAMKHVISRHVNEPRAMYRKNLGWVSFPWGRPGTPPPMFKTDEETLAWWQSLPDKFELFSGGYGVSHIIAKRDWEGRWIKEFQGQRGEDVALKLVEVIARGRPVKKGSQASITFPGYVVILRIDKTQADKEKEY